MNLRLDELTRKDLLAALDGKTKKRAKLIRGYRYIGVTEDFTVYIGVNSVTAKPPTVYTVKIKLLEYPDLLEEKDLSTRERVRLCMAGDMAISCSCPAFRYWGYEYIVSQLDSIVGAEQKIFPKVRNPKLEGVMCKHCYYAIKGFGTFWTRVAKDIDTGNFIKGD